MNSYVSRQQVREINRKLFANDIVYQETDKETLITLISGIIQRYNASDSVSGVPTIIEVKLDYIEDDIFETISLMSVDSVILQFNSKAFLDPKKTAVIKRFKEDKYKILIEVNPDDQVFTLAKIFADIVKFDINNIPEAMIKSSTNQFQCKKLACNVNKPEDYVLAESAGIDYYEGTYISPSTEIEIEKNEHSQVNFIEIITLINDEKSDIKDISKVVSRDSLMSSQIIRLSNSAYFYSSTHIESVHDAIVRVGMQNLKRWVFLLQFSRNSNVPEELLQTSYHRAVFCESIIKEYNKKAEIKPSDAYLIGLFSTLDILTGHPIDSELSRMNLSETVEDALIYRDGIGGQLLNLVRAYEEANWNKVERFIKSFGLNKDKMFKVYFNSLDEVTKLWQSLTRLGEVY